MGNKVWCHPFSSDAIRRKFWKIDRIHRASVNGVNAPSAAFRGRMEAGTTKLGPWNGLFDDPVLHEALDRIMACNRIA